MTQLPPNHGKEEKIDDQTTTVAVFEGRPYIVIMEKFQNVTAYQGVIRGPVGMSVAHALVQLDKAYVEAKKKYEAAWNYDDIKAFLKQEGFEEILAAFWTGD